MSQISDTVPDQFKTVYFRVKGRVQGVYFRASTKSAADKSGITGWVKNRTDGDVDGMATGSEEQLSGFVSWLKQGPKLANVSTVEICTSDAQEYEGFEIR